MISAVFSPPLMPSIIGYADKINYSPFDLTAVREADGVANLVCDVDDCLYEDGGYDNPQSVMGQINKRVASFFQKNGILSPEDAETLAHYLYKTYGNSPWGIYVDGSELSQKFRKRYRELQYPKTSSNEFQTRLVKDFVDYMHEGLDISHLKPDPEQIRLLKSLKEKGLILYVFTNGTRTHMHRVLDQIGLSGIFDGCNCIDDRHYLPKPNKDAYDAVKQFIVEDLNERMLQGTDKRLQYYGGRLVLPFEGDDGFGKHVNVYQMIPASDSSSARLQLDKSSAYDFDENTNRIIFSNGVVTRLHFVFVDDSLRNARAGAENGMMAFHVHHGNAEFSGGNKVVLTTSNGYLRVASSARNVFSALEKGVPLDPSRFAVAPLSEMTVPEQIRIVRDELASFRSK